MFPVLNVSFGFLNFLFADLIETLAGRARRDEVEAGLQRPGKY